MLGTLAKDVVQGQSVVGILISMPKSYEVTYWYQFLQSLLAKTNPMEVCGLEQGFFLRFRCILVKKRPKRLCDGFGLKGNASRASQNVFSAGVTHQNTDRRNVKILRYTI